MLGDYKVVEPKVFKRRGAAQGIVNKETGMNYDPKRDISHALPLIMQNSIIMTQNQLTETEQATPENMEILDTFAHMFAGMYLDSRQQLNAWIKGFNQLYEYINETDNAENIYASLCMYMVLNLYSYLFTSVQMATQTGNTFTTQDFTLNFLVSSLSAMGQDKANAYMQDLASVSGIMKVPPVDFLAAVPENYIKEIKEFHKEQRKKFNNRTKSKKKKN